MWPGNPLLVACSWSVPDQRPCSTCLSSALPAWVASCVRLQARSGGEAISVRCVFCVFHRRRHRYGRLHRPAALTKGQMSDSLGAAPLAQFAPASLTSAPPGTGTGMETEEAARQCTALAMILKSRAHTAARKLRRRRCCGSASSTALLVLSCLINLITWIYNFNQEIKSDQHSSDDWRTAPSTFIF